MYDNFNSYLSDSICPYHILMICCQKFKSYGCENHCFKNVKEKKSFVGNDNFKASISSMKTKSC